MVTLNNEQKVVLHAQPVTEGGNPAGIDGEVTWTVNDPALVTLVPNGFDCEVITNGPLGSATITATADSDLGDGVVVITGVMDIEVVAPPAFSIVITSDDPVAK